MFAINCKLKFIALCLGMIVFHSVWAFFEEKLFRGRYGNEVQANGENGEKFTFVAVFLAAQAIVFTAFAKVVNMVNKVPTKKTNQKYLFWIGLCYVTGSIFGITSLQWIDFPTQVVAKACKPIPVMLMGVFIGRKSYSFRTYLFVVLIVAGVAMFMYKKDNTAVRTENAMLGIYMVSFSLFMDGIQGGFQERLRSKEKILSMDLMLYMNFWCICILTTLLAVTGEGHDCIIFVSRHPTAALHLAGALIFGTGGQACMQSMVAIYGSLPTSIVTTIRKLITVVISSIGLGNHLTIVQWVAAAIVFSSLLLDLFLGKRKEKQETPEVEPEDKPKKPEESITA